MPKPVPFSPWERQTSASWRAQTARQTATHSKTRSTADAANSATEDMARRSALSRWNRKPVIGRRGIGKIGAGCSPGTQKHQYRAVPAPARANLQLSHSGLTPFTSRKDPAEDSFAALRPSQKCSVYADDATIRGPRLTSPSCAPRIAALLNQKIKTGPELVIATKRYAKDSTLISWFHLLSTSFLLLLAIAGTHWNFGIFGKLACSVLSGLLFLRLFVIYHDQQHHAILPRSRMAEHFMRLFGLLVLSPSSVWRSSHGHHHKHNSKLRGSNIGSFPIMTKSQYLKSPASVRLKYLFMRHPLTILFGYVFVFSIGMCIGPFLKDPRRNYDGLLALLLHVAIGAVLVHYWGWMGLLLTQTLPHFILYAFGSYLFYAQHNFPGVSFNDNAGWTYDRAALDSSSYMRTSRLMAWFTANIGYHHIHHLNARIPFYRLPEAFREIPELGSPRETTLHPLEIFRCLRLKVWDVELQRMTGLDDAMRQSAPS